MTHFLVFVLLLTPSSLFVLLLLAKRRLCLVFTLYMGLANVTLSGPTLDSTGSWPRPPNDDLAHPRSERHHVADPTMSSGV